MRNPLQATSALCTPTYPSRCRRSRRCSVSTLRPETTAPRVSGAAQRRISAARVAGLVRRCPCDARCDSAVSKEKKPYNAVASPMRSCKLSASDHSGRTTPARPGSVLRTRRPPRLCEAPHTNMCTKAGGGEVVLFNSGRAASRFGDGGHHRRSLQARTRMAQALFTLQGDLSLCQPPQLAAQAILDGIEREALLLGVCLFGRSLRRCPQRYRAGGGRARGMAFRAKAGAVGGGLRGGRRARRGR